MKFQALESRFLKSLAFVANTEQERIVDRQVPGATIATGDFAVLANLAQSGQVVDLWQWVDEVTQDRHRNAAWTFSRRVASVLSGRYVFRGCDLVDSCKFDLFWAVQSALNCTVAARGAIDRIKPEQVIHFSEMTTPDMTDPPRGPPDVFNACAATVAGAYNIPVKILSCPSSLPVATAFKPVSSSGLDPANSTTLPRRVDVLAISENLGVDEQALLIAQAARSSLRWVSISGEAPRAVTPYLPLKHLRWLPLDLEDMPDRLGHFMNEAFPQLRSELLKEYPDVFGNHRLEFIWTRFAQHLGAAMREAALGMFLGSSFAPGVVVMGCDVPGPGRAFVSGLMACGVPVVSMDHVGFGWAQDNRWNEDSRTHLAVWSEVDRTARITIKPKGCRVEAVGSARIDFAAAPRAVASRVQRRAVFFTSMTISSHRLTGWAKPRDVLEVWAEIARILCELGVVETVVKPHPRYDHPSFYEEHLAQLIPGLQIARGDAASALEGAAFAVLVCVPSTVLVQIILAGVPAIYMRKGVQAWARSPIEDGGVIVCDDEDSLRDAMRRALDDHAWRLEVISRQRAFLTKSLSATGEESAARLVKLVGEVAVKTCNEPDPANRWLVDMLAIVERRLWGSLNPDDFSGSMRALSSIFREEWLRRNDIEWRQVSRWLLRVVVWSGDTTERRFDIAKTLISSMPEALRPSRRVVREHLAEIADQEHKTTTGMRRFVHSLRLLTLAPRRLARPKIQRMP